MCIKQSIFELLYESNEVHKCIIAKSASFLESTVPVLKYENKSDIF
jgi:hypothetical protein